MSTKIIMIKPLNPEQMEGSLMLQHSEACFAVRRHIIEKAKVHWKEIKDINTNHVLGLCLKKQDMLDSTFSEHVNVNLGWQLGEQFQDLNTSIIYNTFL